MMSTEVTICLQNSSQEDSSVASRRERLENRSYDKHPVNVHSKYLDLPYFFDLRIEVYYAHRYACEVCCLPFTVRIAVIN